MKRGKKKAWFYSMPFLIIVGLMIVVPLLYTVEISFTNMSIYHWKDYHCVGLDNYKKALLAFDSGFLPAFLRTLLWTVSSMALQLIFGFFVAVGLNAKGLKLRRVYKTLLIVPWAMPAYVSILLWRMGIFNTEFGLFNQILKQIGGKTVNFLSTNGMAFISCLVVNLWLGVPYMFTMMDGAMQSIDRNIYESAELDGEFVDRDKLEPKHFQKWVDFAKERGMGLDFNPTFFSHPMVKDGLTLSSPDEEVRNFWIEHGKACIRISQYFAEQTGVPCVMNIWTGDGFKDIPADRMGPRVRYKESIDAILSEPFDTNLVKPCVESKVFGIGVEAYTVGSAEFSLSYAAMNKDKCLPLMDNGHYHPTEVVSDKIPALLTFFPEIALHVTRPIRWDSDHVVLFDDETKEIAKEIVRCENGIDRTYIALDYFDASINRISAWVTGFRSFQKALLDALCQPSEMLKELQDTNQMSKKMVVMEQCKTLPIGDVWEEYCRQCGVEAEGWFDEIQKYEDEVLSKRA